MSLARKAMVIGLDALVPALAARFVGQGLMPNLAHLERRGMVAGVLPTLPASTPPGWTAVATGAWPGTSGVEGFSVHRPGEPLDRRTNGCVSTACRAEFLWNTAERAGRLPVLLKWPVSWPSTLTRGIQVDGSGGWGGLLCEHELAPSQLVVGAWSGAVAGVASNAAGPGGGAATAAGPGGGTAGAASNAAGAEDPSVPRYGAPTRDEDTLHLEAPGSVELRAAGEWRRPPGDARPLAECPLVLRARRGAVPPRLGAVVLESAAGLRLAVVPEGERDLGRALAVLAPGEWSPWLVEGFEVQGRDLEGSLRFKLLRLDAEGFALYSMQSHRTEGFSRPPQVSRELVRDIGPFPEWTAAYDLLQGWIDHDTQMEIYQQHAAWMTAATAHLLDRYPWDLFFVQAHFVDWAQHIYWGAIDPGHPDYNPAEAPRFWDLLGRVYALADGLVGAALERAGDDTLVLVMGDHGQELYHTTLLINNLLAREGLLGLDVDPRSGSVAVDWSRTRAFAYADNVYVNLKGRDPQGLVEPQEYEALRDRIIDLLYGLRDRARGGRAPVYLASRREDLDGWGLEGEGVGDVVYTLKTGYQARSALYLAGPAGAAAGTAAAAGLDALRPTRLFRQHTGEHDSSNFLGRGVRTALYLAGPGVRAGARRRAPVRLVDVAPTLCHALGLPLPAHCQGDILSDVFNQGRETA